MALGVWGNKYQGLLNDPRVVQSSMVRVDHPSIPGGSAGEHNTGAVKNSKPAQNEDEAGGG